MGLSPIPAEFAPVEITDPVAGLRYVLDPSNQVAHQSQLPPRPVPPGIPPMPGRGVAPGIAPGGALGAARGGRGVALQGVGIPVTPANPTRPVTTSENLGAQTIDGVPVEGRKITTTYPAGSQGNDRPIVVTSETWNSPELRLMILSKTVDPRSGENIMRMDNLSRSEPDPGLFQVPPGYQIVEETGPFTIQIKRP
jgi:hypothetical protein